MSSACCCCVSVSQSNVAVVERLGRFDGILPPGFHCLNLGWSTDGTVSLRVRMMNVVVRSTTSERTGVTLVVNVMYRVIPSEVHTAYYSMADPSDSIESFVINAVRSESPRYTLDDMYCMKGELANRVKEPLTERLGRYGYEIVDVLVSDVNPAPDVLRAITTMVTNRYGRMVSATQADIGRIESVKHAEALAEVKRLSGVGTAGMQMAATASLQSLLEQFRSNNGLAQRGEGKVSQSSDLMAMILMQQRLDTLEEISRAKGSRLICKPEACEKKLV